MKGYRKWLFEEQLLERPQNKSLSCGPMSKAKPPIIIHTICSGSPRCCSEPRVRFGDPLTMTRSSQPGQRVAKTAWSSIHGYVTSQNFSPVNQILIFNKKATINLLKCLLGFKSILYLISSTQHTQACFFIKNNCLKLVLFYWPWEIVDQDREPSEKLGPQIQEQV